MEVCTMEDTQGTEALLMEELAELRQRLVELKALASALDAMQDAFYVFNLQGKFLRWNKALGAITGYNDDEIATMMPLDFFSAENVERVAEAIERVVKEGQANVVADLVAKDGRGIPYEFAGALLKDNEGNPAAICGVGRDIIERKRTEEALQFERKQLLSIFDSIDEVIYVADPHTYQVLYVNKALQDAFGEPLVGSICYEAFQGFDAPCEFCTNSIILANMYEPHRWEYHNPVLDRDYAIVDRIIRWPDGRDVRFELAIDVTEQVRAKEAVRRAFVSRTLVGQMLRDLQAAGNLREGAMFQAGQALATRVEAKTLPGFLDAFADMGLGTLTLLEFDESRQRWTFWGDKLVESQTESWQPTGHYSRGFLCGAVSRVQGGVRVVGEEMACQSMGDELCRFVVQVVGE
jgi:PAS domain S-box-containing protein